MRLRMRFIFWRIRRSFAQSLLLPDMGLAVERIVQAMGDLEERAGRVYAVNPEKIMIVGDRDADGITSTALVADYLLDYGVAPVLRLPQGMSPMG